PTRGRARAAAHLERGERGAVAKRLRGVAELRDDVAVALPRRKLRLIGGLLRRERIEGARLLQLDDLIDHALPLDAAGKPLDGRNGTGHRPSSTECGVRRAANC